MGAVEEGGRVASGVVDSMKSQPLALALLVINILFIGMFGWIANTLSNMRQIEIQQNRVILDQLKTTCEYCRLRAPPGPP